MKNKITRKKMILKMFKEDNDTKLTCQEITKRIIKEQKLTDNVAHYLSGSITTILAKLVKDNILKYANEKTNRGGHIYQKPMSYE